MNPGAQGYAAGGPAGRPQASGYGPPGGYAGYDSARGQHWQDGPNVFAEPAEPSLTGHILAQGSPDVVVPQTRTTKVMIVMLVVLGVLVIAGLTVAIFAGDQVTNWLGSFFTSG